MKIGVLLALSIALAACESQPPVENAVTSTDDNIMADAMAADAAVDAALKNADAASAAKTAATTDMTAWVYNTSKDELTGKEIKTACVTSDNQVSLDFPYDNTTARLCIRQHPQWGRDIYVSLDDDGQILCNSYRGCSLGVRFGDGEVSSYEGTEPEDNSSTTVFVSDGSGGRFLSNLKTAKETAIQIQFYQAGSQTLLFKTAGLKWGGSKAE
jgi:hypothetical protein